MTPFLQWLKSAGDPTPQAWLITVGYFVAMGLCLRAAHVSRRNAGADAGVWRMLAGVLGLFGLNKQLDLQTLLITVGRAGLSAEGWYGERRLLQKLFVAVLLLVAVGVMTWAAVRHGAFWRVHWLMSLGMALVLGFALLRAAEINHVEPDQPAAPFGPRWRWLIEAAGVILCSCGALRVRSAIPVQPGPVTLPGR